MINKQTYGFKILAAVMLMAAMAGNAFAAPTFAQGPVITSPTDGGTVSGKTPVTGGNAQASQTVTLEARDADGNLLLSDVAATTSAAVGGPAVVPGVHFDNTALGAGGVAATNPQTTAADGFYVFMTIDGDFYLDVQPPAGYVYPSAATTWPTRITCHRARLSESQENSNKA